MTDLDLFRHGAQENEKAAVRRIWNLLNIPLALRLGETTVISKLVHTQDMGKPGEIGACQNADAGRAFYGRENIGEIIHIDVFHSQGHVVPSFLASHLKEYLNGVLICNPLTKTMESPSWLFPYMDIQTGLGGGRLDGLLMYGREEGVRKAHTTHVHLATLFAKESVCCLPTIVRAVEAAIQESNLELRKIETILMSKEGAPADLDDYKTNSDSLLKNTHGRDGNTQRQTGEYRKEALAKTAAEKVGSVKDAIDVLEKLEAGMRHGDFSKTRSSRGKTGEQIQRSLLETSLMRFENHKYVLSDDGALALSYLKNHSLEIEAYLRRLLWVLPQKTSYTGKAKGHDIVPSQGRGRSFALPPSKLRNLSSLDIPQTLIQKGSAKVFSPNDLRFSYIREQKGSPVILLIDASASMAGRRMAAAKELARHLCHTRREKISVIAFQDCEAKVMVEFTKSLPAVEKGLEKISAQGLTPLGKGLETALALSQKSTKKPLILCVTDGIPTVSRGPMPPMEDAISMAQKLRQKGIKLGCIGLEPNRRFLREMVSAANGTLHVVNELEAQSLASIARQEAY